MADQIFRKDTDYGKRNDYEGKDELTVTITLAEYRELVAVKACRDYEKQKIEERARKAEQRSKDLEKIIDEMKDGKNRDESGDDCDLY